MKYFGVHQKLYTFILLCELTDKTASNRYDVVVGSHPKPKLVYWMKIIFVYARACIQSHKMPIYGFIIEGNKKNTYTHKSTRRTIKTISITISWRCVGVFGCEYVHWNRHRYGTNRQNGNCTARNDRLMSDLSAIQLNSIQINLYYSVPIICFLFLIFFPFYNLP